MSEQNVQEEVVVSVDALKAKLTNKNEQYVFQLERELKAAGFEEAQIEKELALMLPQIIEHQKSGVTARQLFGTVTERVHAIVDGPAKDPDAKSPDWQIALDGGLLVGGLFALVTGVMLMLNPDSGSQPMGLLTLIINFIAGAFVMLAISKNAPKFDNPKGQRGYIRYLVVSTVAMVAWLLLVVASQSFIPNAINLVMSYEWYLLIGAAALAAKFYLKKKLNIVGSVM